MRMICENKNDKSGGHILVELFRDGFSSHTAQQFRIAFYHNLSPDTMNQTITAELIKHRDKHIAESRICPGTYLPNHKAVYFDLNRVILA